MPSQCYGKVVDWDSPNLFRYVGESEFYFIRTNGYVKSINSKGTYWTTLLTEDPECAKELLGLNREVRYRVAGPLKSVLSLLRLEDYEVNLIKPQEPGFSRHVIEIVIRRPLPPASIFDMLGRSLVT